MITAYDKQISTEPDYGYEKWCNGVWELVTKDDCAPTDQEVSDYWDKFFEPLTLRLSTCGTLPSGGCAPSFAALVIVRRWRHFKNQFPFLLPFIKNN